MTVDVARYGAGPEAGLAADEPLATAFTRRPPAWGRLSTAAWRSESEWNSSPLELPCRSCDPDSGEIAATALSRDWKPMLELVADVAQRPSDILIYWISA